MMRLVLRPRGHTALCPVPHSRRPFPTHPLLLNTEEMTGCSPRPSPPSPHRVSLLPFFNTHLFISFF